MAFTYCQGTTPVLISIPHNGSFIPGEIAATMTDDGKSSRDTDWFLDRLYSIPELSQSSLCIAVGSRYVVDLNRSATNESLYPGQTTTGLIPETCFDGSPIYLEAIPDAEEVARRIKDFWQPYHQWLEQELERMNNEFGFAILIEAHSIASRVPRLFEGTLPDFNLGTNRGASCDQRLLDAAIEVLEDQAQYSYVANERFVGGYITREFGRPENNWHALQIELSQATYMNEEDATWDDEKASEVQKVFRNFFSAINKLNFAK